MAIQSGVLAVVYHTTPSSFCENSARYRALRRDSGGEGNWGCWVYRGAIGVLGAFEGFPVYLGFLGYLGIFGGSRRSTELVEEEERK